MIWSIAVTVRLPGARTAPVRRTFTCCQTGLEKTGEKMPMTLVKAIGKESMVILSGSRELRFHCRSSLTQMAINGQSRAKLDFIHLCRITESLGQAVQQCARDFHHVGLHRWHVKMSRGPQVSPHHRDGIDKGWQGFAIPCRLSDRQRVLLRQP